MSFNSNNVKSQDCGSDSLLSFLEQALESSADTHQISHKSLPVSFNNPFEDLEMEPLPIRSNSLPSVVSSSPFIPSMKNMNSVSVDDFIGSKRRLRDIFEDVQDHQVPSLHKRRRVDSVDETTARFRPYQEQQWRKQLKKVIEYKLENGHCCVPHSYPEDPVLARWVKRQRYQCKKFNDGDATSTMTHRRIQELESIGFVWHSHAAAWMEKFNELKAFKLRNGHCNVPSHYPENVSLSTWVKCQRRQYKLCVNGGASSMTMKRYQALEALGFVFEGRQQQQQGWSFKNSF